MTCERCGRETAGYTGSMFNTELICLIPCEKAERHHPMWEEARRAESDAVLRGEMNFVGVGLPDDLRPGGAG